MIALPTDTDAPLLVFGGPYSNLHALQAMRARAEALAIPPERVICTGDVIAYCAEPEETVRAIREWGCIVIAGNCEEQIAAGAPDCGCGFGEGTACDLLSRGWYAYASARISAESRAWMAALAPRLDFTWAGRRVTVLHGALDASNRFVFASSPAAEKAADLARAGADIILAGHCGLPFVQRLGRGVWFNAGAIGIPANDGTRDGWYGVMRRAGGNIAFELCRLAYDWRGAVRAMRAAGHAQPYAVALETGLWPSIDVLPPAERAARGMALEETTLTLAEGGAEHRVHP